ncbi:AsmA-like C-terminal region-containing protein [uncultured Marinobacter sp.]|uniref:YhdP family phospholipid transporter n=1 Tax=uncultured Marinobacter sp. TaxID=187379 RepID=UPI0030DDD670
MCPERASSPSAGSGANDSTAVVIARKLTACVGWLLLILLILVAVAAAMARHLAETVDEYRPAVEAVLAERTGQDVSIGRLRANWQGPSLTIEATRVTLGGVGMAAGEQRRAEPIRLGQLRFRLDGLKSLLRLGLVFDRIEADSLDMILTRNQQDRLQLAAWRDRDDGDHPEIPELPEVLEESWIPEHWKDPDFWLDQLARRVSDPQFRVTRITLGVESPDQDTVYIDVPQLDLVIEDGVVAASGRAMRSGTTEQLATITLVGSHLFDGEFTGRLHANLRPGRVLNAFTREMRWRHLDIVSGEAEAEAWLNFEAGYLISLNAGLQIPRLEVTSHGTGLPSLEDFSAAVGWQRNPAPSQGRGQGLFAGGQWHVQDLQWRWRDQRVEGIDLKVQKVFAGKDTGYEITAASVPLTGLSALIRELDILPGAAQRALERYQPGGTLAWARLRMPGSGDSPFELSASMDNVSVVAHGGAPGGSNIDGFLWLDSRGGWVEVDSHDATLGFPELFTGAWAADSLAGRVSWRLEPGIIRVFGRNLSVRYQQDTRLTGAFDLKLDFDGDDSLGLAIGLENGRADMLADFVPARVVSEGLYQWLTTAITGGVIEQGQFFAHGQIGRDLPPGSFSTSMRFRFRDGEITYDPRWPEVTGAVGEVVINNGRTDVRLEQALTGGLALEPGRVQVLEDAGAALVQVDTAAKVTGEQVAFWLANTPLGEMAGAAADTIELAGDFNVELGLGIPLDPDRDFSVSGRLQTSNGEIRYPPAGLVWFDVQGDVAYSNGGGDQNGLQAGNISARFLGHPVAVTLGLNGDQRQLRIQQEGRADVAAILGQFLPERAGNADPGIDGFLPYRANLVIAPDAGTSLRIRAETGELISAWPEPLGLGAGTSRAGIDQPPLEFGLRWADNNQLYLNGQWGDRASVYMGWQHGEIFGADVHLGDVGTGAQSDAGPLAPGVRLKGRFSRLEPARWQAMAGELFPGQPGSGSSENGLLYSASVPWLQRLDIHADNLVFGTMAFPEVSLSVTPEAGGWLIATSSERATGRLRLPAGGKLAWLDLERLQLARGDSPDGDSSGGDDNSGTILTPTQQLEAFRQLATDDWPQLDVRIESLWLGEQQAGAWSFVMNPEADQVVVRDIQGRLGSLALDGQLSWGIRTGEARTALSANIEGGELAELSALIGDDIPLTNRATVIGLELDWTGRPDQLAPDQLNGDLVVRLDDGVILEGNNTAQLFRLFNLLNTDTLQRRLRFDFSDLYEAGVAFDAISGTASLTNGVLEWTPELQLAGPSGAFRLTGSTSLVDESLDMRLVVILPLTQNLPLAAILIGASPPIGGALFVLDKLLGEPLSRLTSATYSVSGSWDDPDVRLRNIFDTGE